jgi:uncharacterized membrane protein (DUF106 family)
MIRIIFWTVVIGIIFRIVFYYLLPIFRITSATTTQMRRMQEQMREMERKMNEPPPAAKKVKKEGDFIEYEELK